MDEIKKNSKFKNFDLMDNATRSNQLITIFTTPEREKKKIRLNSHSNQQKNLLNIPQQSPKIPDRFIRKTNISRALFKKNEDYEPPKVKKQCYEISPVRHNNSSSKRFYNLNFELFKTIKSKLKLSDNTEILSNLPIEKPSKIMQVPNIREDFYFNLLDWSHSQLLAIALDSTILTYCTRTNFYTKLSELFLPIQSNTRYYTCIKFSPKQNSHLLACGNSLGSLELWDVSKNQKISSIDNSTGSETRILALSWKNQNVLTYSAGTNGGIITRDIRMNVSENPVSKDFSHKQEVIGLSWSPDERYLISGGNDKQVFAWSPNCLQYPEIKLQGHKSAVKAISWKKNCQILATGGGNNDQKIKLWDLQKMEHIADINCNSQICNLDFSKKEPNLLVSSHGFNGNRIYLWDTSKLEVVSKFEGHSQRVLYMAQHFSGDFIATAAGDELLKFWNLDKKVQETNSQLLPSCVGLR